MTRARLVAVFIVLTLFGRALADNKPDIADPSWLKLNFPKVEGWNYIDREKLPGDGYSVGYNYIKEKIIVTVYVYNRGHDRIADDLNAPEVQREFEGAKGALGQAQKLGYYKKVEQEQSGESTLGDAKLGRKALYARFRLTIDADNVTTSEIYVLPYKDHFIKLRITRLLDTKPESVTALDSLKTELAGMLGK